MSYRRSYDGADSNVAPSTAGATASRDLAGVLSAIEAFYQVMEEPAQSSRIQKLDLELTLTQLMEAASRYRDVIRRHNVISAH